jgi:hypothetical protein
MHGITQLCIRCTAAISICWTSLPVSLTLHSTTRRLPASIVQRHLPMSCQCLHVIIDTELIAATNDGYSWSIRHFAELTDHLLGLHMCSYSIDNLRRSTMLSKCLSLPSQCCG